MVIMAREKGGLRSYLLINEEIVLLSSIKSVKYSLQSYLAIAT